MGNSPVRDRKDRCNCSALGRIRTCDTRFRKPMLYPLSYEGGADRLRGAKPTRSVILGGGAGPNRRGWGRGMAASGPALSLSCFGRRDSGAASFAAGQGGRGWPAIHREHLAGSSGGCTPVECSVGLVATPPSTDRAEQLVRGARHGCCTRSEAEGDTCVAAVKGDLVTDPFQSRHEEEVVVALEGICGEIRGGRF